VIDSPESQQVYAELKAFLLKRLETSPPVLQKKASLEDTDAINLRLTVASQFMASNSI
jgi:hypothetical protein